MQRAGNLQQTRFEELDMKLKINPYSAFLHCALVALGVLVAVLAQENHQLKQPQVADAVESSLEIGQAVAAVGLEHLDGGQETLDFSHGEKDRLLLVFTTTCSACKANQPTWRALHEQIGDSMEIVGVSLSEIEDTRDYRLAHDLMFPVAVPADRDHFTEVFEISAIPMTIRIGSDGRVRGSWVGALSPAQVAEVSPALHG